MDRGAWWATVHGVIKSWTRLKRLNTNTHVCFQGRLGAGRELESQRGRARRRPQEEPRWASHSGDRSQKQEGP